MPLYEHVYLARQDVSAQQVEDLTKQFTSVIEGLGGSSRTVPARTGAAAHSSAARRSGSSNR